MWRHLILTAWLVVSAGGAAVAEDTVLAFGKAGTPAGVDRTVDIVTSESGFSISSVSVRAGETVAFRVTNKGEELHEFLITTVEEQRKHLEQMADMMGEGEDGVEMMRESTLQEGLMMDDPNILFVEPGFTETLIWTFTEPGDLIFACNVVDGSDRSIQGAITVFPR